MAPYIFRATCCIHETCDFEDFLPGCKVKSECLCCVREECFAPLFIGEKSLGCGNVTNPDNNECCKLGMICCAYGLKKPERCCAVAAHVCCLKEAGALPLDREYQEELMCSYNCLTCAPTCGCFVVGPEVPALSKPLNDYTRYCTTPVGASNQMDRFDDDPNDCHDRHPVVVAQLVGTSVSDDSKKVFT